MSEIQPEGQAPNPPPKKTLLIATAGAALVGALIVVGAVLPAEYNQDPLGIGKATGLSRLWAPKEVSLDPTEGNQPLQRDAATAWRTDVIEIPLPGDGAVGSELEYKVRMKKGATLIYSWKALAADGSALPEDEFYYDMHGHTVPPKGSKEEMVVSTYKQLTGTGGNGALIAPFDGIQGWYLQNQAIADAKVTLRVAGFYELVPPGEVGNEAGILPVGGAR